MDIPLSLIFYYILFNLFGKPLINIFENFIIFFNCYYMIVIIFECIKILN